MKRFLINISIFIFILPIVVVSLFWTTDLLLNTKNAENTIFIWGDSQAYQGIDLKTLNRITNKRILTAAKHGAGVYDFLVFTEKVPKNADVIIALSKPVQLRAKESDRNTSGFSFNSLLTLYQNNYSFSELYSIMLKNKKPYSLFDDYTNLYKYSDTITFTESVSLLRKVYKKIPPYLSDKQNIIIKGINKLQHKNCNIYFIEFPFHKIIHEIENKSIIKKETTKFKNRIMNLNNINKCDTIKLDSLKQNMYDLTHLNEYGAFQVSKGIGSKINEKKQAIFFIID